MKYSTWNLTQANKSRLNQKWLQTLDKTFQTYSIQSRWEHTNSQWNLECMREAVPRWHEQANQTSLTRSGVCWYRQRNENTKEIIQNVREQSNIRLYPWIVAIWKVKPKRHKVLAYYNARPTLMIFGGAMHYNLINIAILNTNLSPVKTLISYGADLGKSNIFFFHIHVDCIAKRQRRLAVFSSKLQNFPQTHLDSI